MIEPCETLEFYSYLRHRNSPPCETLEFHSHMRHWNFTTTYSQNICISHRGYCTSVVRTSVYSPKVFIILIVSASYRPQGLYQPLVKTCVVVSGIYSSPVIRTFVVVPELHNHMRNWNYTAIRDTGISQQCETGISQPCETLEFHMYVRHWNSTTM
jgi:hypothetical protein